VSEPFLPDLQWNAQCIQQSSVEMPEGMECLAALLLHSDFLPPLPQFPPPKSVHVPERRAPALSVGKNQFKSIS
jgi:hypothetical protein